ncbi:MAG: tRNA (N6-isopentenyl adenosine(37)-C2)-methylthiotransferase MiaB, partial [Candidatus Woodwardiibium sp.]
MNEQRMVPPEEIERQKAVAARLKAAGGGRVWIKTFGCQQNEADSEKLLGICELCGYTPTDDPAQADLILVNTCAIREHAELRALSGAGQLKKLKADKPGLLIAVCGCMV